MASTREIRRRIRSISSTAQITKAMQMVAASKMRKAQQAALVARPFLQMLYRIQRKAVTRAIDFEHPLLQKRPVKTRAIVLIASDKGLCGALNSNLFRVAARYEPASTVFITAGRKAAQFVTRTRRKLVADFPYGDSPRFAEARAVAALCRDLFLKGEVDEVRIVTSRFVNTLTQTPISVELLPIGEITEVKIQGAEPEETLVADTTEYVFEPDANIVLGYLLPHYLNILMFLAMVNAKASEQSARMVSMKNATDNAETMIKDLTLEYNKMRQGFITQELLEIAGGQSG
jgi:F-type H+-transporting ATPase subunit gamma